MTAALKFATTGNKCGPHYRGVDPDAPPFFNAGCIVCEDKRARGIVTGNEPPTVMGGHWKFGMRRKGA